MRESAVLSRLAKKNQNYKKSIVGSPDAYEPSTSTSDSVLENLQSAYHKLEETRKRVFNISVSFKVIVYSNFKNIQETHVSQCCNYKRMNDVFFEDIKLVMEHLLETFKKSDISQEQEVLILLFIYSMLKNFLSRKIENFPIQIVTILEAPLRTLHGSIHSL